MKTIILVTNNKKKCAELQQLLTMHDISVNTYSEVLGHRIDIEETGLTFEENAIIKVKAVQQLGSVFENSIILADDSGIEVQALNNEPGIYSARYGGPTLDDLGRCNYLLEQLGSNPNRVARFRCVIAAKFPNRDMISFDGRVSGHICESITGEGGFGYDPIFIPDGYNDSFGNLDPAIKSRISHRAQALNKFAQSL